tara:strand:+ start:19028 stop:20578 length:1551 start_codon:yes stop_codon:yes gene_type:complete
VNASPSPVSVVIPTGGNQRLHLLEATLAGLRRAHGIDQIILAETGSHPYASDLAKTWDIDYVFSRDSGRFNKSRTLNMGSKLARRRLILWCDGDTLFDAQLIPRAVGELKRRKLDVLMPFSTFHCLTETETEQVIAGTVPPNVFTPHTYRNNFGKEASGGIVLVRAAFLQRCGGHLENFSGWGYEDDAWVHKVKILGRIGWDDDSDLHVCNLFHPECTRDASNLAFNEAMFEKIASITDPDELLREFPHETQEAPPWNISTRIEFVAAERSGKASASNLAESWISRLRQNYGVSPSLRQVDRAALDEFSAGSEIDMTVVFAATHEVAQVMLDHLQGKPAIVVLMSNAVPGDSELPLPRADQPHWLLARTAEQAAVLRELDERIWHRNWEDGERKAQPVPLLVQLLSLALETKKRWSVKIELDRSALPAPALDRSPFWYVLVQDAEGNELFRCDAERDELTRLTTSPASAITLERSVPSAQRPARWVVQPTDRHRNWLGRMEGSVKQATVNRVEAGY